LRVPVAADCSRFDDWSACLDLDQDDEGRGDRNRRGSVEQNAERAMVGVSVYRVDVRYLDNSEQCQQDEAHHGDHGQSMLLCAAFSAEMRLKSCQRTPSASRIHFIGCARAGRGYASCWDFDRIERQT
jgi:hypothetical protein